MRVTCTNQLKVSYILHLLYRLQRLRMMVMIIPMMGILIIRVTSTVLRRVRERCLIRRCGLGSRLDQFNIMGLNLEKITRHNLFVDERKFMLRSTHREQFSDDLRNLGLSSFIYQHQNLRLYNSRTIKLTLWSQSVLSHCRLHHLIQYLIIKKHAL